MEPFIGKDFLLYTSTAKALYHEHAEGLPIVDYHTHLDPQKIAEDYQFKSITELWLYHSPYRWRAMRTNGISEKYITGAATDWEKFQKWAQTMPYLFRNPLYHWAQLELKRVFGIDKLLSPDTAKEIFDTCGEMLKLPEFSACGMLKHFGVELVCTANDMTDSLVYHKQIRKSKQPCKVMPTWKPDRLFELDDPAKFDHYIEELSEVSDIIIRTYAELIEALRRRHAYFHSQGCRVSDVSIDSFYVDDYAAPDVDEIFQKIIFGKKLTANEIVTLKASLLMELCELDYKAGWTQQYHIGGLVDVNTTMFKLLGRHTGFDACNDSGMAVTMGRFFNRIFERGLLCRTIVYNLNPKDFEMFAVMMGCFQDGSIPEKIQLGPAWWYLNDERGIRLHLDVLSHQSLLSRFIGMVTDSHSFISFPRHEYFRRILCNVIGEDIENGKIPASEINRIGRMVEDICYNNAKRYFNV